MSRDAERWTKDKARAMTAKPVVVAELNKCPQKHTIETVQENIIKNAKAAKL